MNLISFDTLLNRRGTNSSKWDAMPYGASEDDMIPMWVADMDFACPPAVIEPIYNRLLHPVFGYSELPANYWDSIINWHKQRYDGCIDSSQIIPVASVLGGVAMAIQAFTQKGDSILVPTPGYHAFYNSIINNERTLVTSPLKRIGDHYELDFDLIEMQLKTQPIRLIIFCSPHNPTGRSWTREELKKLVELCTRYRVLLISDEIHADFSFSHPFTPVFSASPQADDIAVALYSPTKTFNIAGLCTAYAVIKNQELASKFNKAILASGLKVKNTLGICALIGAYENGGAWVDSLLTYLADNRTYAVNFINEQIPCAHAYLPEATYFLWIDFRKSGFSPEEIMYKCVNEAQVAILSGSDFIENGDYFVRMNIACPRKLLEEALSRIQTVFS